MPDAASGSDSRTRPPCSYPRHGCLPGVLRWYLRHRSLTLALPTEDLQQRRPYARPLVEPNTVPGRINTQDDLLRLTLEKVEDDLDAQFIECREVVGVGMIFNSPFAKPSYISRAWSSSFRSLRSPRQSMAGLA